MPRNGHNPLRLVLELQRLSPEAQNVVKEFLTLCVIKGVRKEDEFLRLVEAEVVANEAEVRRNWMEWDELENFMLTNNFTINRTTFWNYRKNGIFDGMVVSNGVTTLYDADAILAHFKGQ